MLCSPLHRLGGVRASCMQTRGVSASSALCTGYPLWALTSSCSWLGGPVGCMLWEGNFFSWGGACGYHDLELDKPIARHFLWSWCHCVISTLLVGTCYLRAVVSACIKDMPPVDALLLAYLFQYVNIYIYIHICIYIYVYVCLYCIPLSGCCAPVLKAHPFALCSAWSGCPSISLGSNHPLASIMGGPYLSSACHGGELCCHSSAPLPRA